MDFSFFTTDNKSGHKTKETWFSKNYPKEYSEIINYSEGKLPQDTNFKEKIWIYFHKLESRPKCLGCDNLVKFSNRFDKGGYLDFCSLSCANNNQKILNERAKKSNQEKWGVDYYSQHKDFIPKQKKTKKERYGNENYNNVQKMKETKEILYGNSSYNNSDKNKITRRNSFIELIKEKTKDKFISYNLEDDNIVLECSICGNNYEIYNNLFNYRTKQNSILCTKCNLTEDKQTSGLEKSLSLFVSSLKEIEVKNRSLLGGKEIDILIPNEKIAIEFNGLFWHSDLFLDKEYHLNKTNLTNSKGYDLIHIFEDEWLEKTDIVKSIIKTKLNLVEKRIFARKCEIKKISTKDEKYFLNQNHIQGFVGSKVVYGLYYENVLVSVMSFGGLRKSLGYKQQDGCYEMLRFCNKLNLNVVGGASKLFNHFIKNHSPKKVISYSDKRYFNGETYVKLGFVKNGETKPNYYYTLKHKKYNRYAFRKDVLVKQGFESK